jgi:hypothetical protein
MDTVHDDRFMVFLRIDASHHKAEALAGEQPLASCRTYAEARRIRASLNGSAMGECVIRYVGPSGGGD